jgi:hypothetical protein
LEIDSTMSSATPRSPGDVLAGRFKILRMLGEGGMGAVYEVEHLLTKHQRALKLLHPELTLSPSIVARFLREASAAGRIGNPHVVETFDAGRLDSGDPYIVMEFLKGRTLAELITETGPLELERTCQVMMQACDGIGAAHQAGIIHRDVKPENMFLLAGDAVFVKILDFGISKFDPELTGAPGITQDGATMGTPFYMSPEQVLGTPLDAQADVYALGVVLYECLTAQKPYLAETLPHLAVMICEGQFAPPSTRRSELPAGWDEIVARAMAKDKAARYASVAELKQAIEQQRGARLSDEAAARARAKLLAGPVSGTTQVLLAPAVAVTADAFARTQPAAASAARRHRGVWLAGITALALLSGWLLQRLGSNTVSDTEPVSQAAASATPGLASARAVPVTPQPASTAAATPSLDVSAKRPVPSESVPANKGALSRAPAPATSRKAAPGSVSRQLGLSEDNPF